MNVRRAWQRLLRPIARPERAFGFFASARLWPLAVAVTFAVLWARPVPAQEPHYVFAHYMVCCPRAVIDASGRMSGQPRVEDFLAEIEEAHAAGIDGFALNCGEWNGHPRYRAFSAMLFEAARRFGPGFRLFFSADQVTADEAADMVATYAGHPNYFRFRGRPVLSSYDGSPDWGRAIRESYRRQTGGEIFFVPYFYPPTRHEAPGPADIRALVNEGSDLDGFFYFSAGQDFSARSTRLHARAWKRQKKIFMAGIAPYYRGLRANYRIFDSKGFSGLVNLWTTAIAEDVDWVELVTWNDWEEDTYFAPLGVGAPSRATEWWGLLLSHDGYLQASRYFIDWFKTGQPPAIHDERIFYSYRLNGHESVGTPVPSSPQVSTPRGVAALEDRIFLLALLNRDADVTVLNGGARTTIHVAAGMRQFAVKMHDGPVELTVRREGRLVADRAIGLPIDLAGRSGNFNTLAGVLDLPATPQQSSR